MNVMPTDYKFVDPVADLGWESKKKKVVLIVKYPI
jgi:hypothetical protein